MTLVTGTVQDLGYDGMEGTLWARPARFRSDGQVVYAPERKPYKITGGVVSAELAPGPAVLELQVGSHARGTFEVVIPEADTTLADLLDTVFPWEPAQVSLFVAEREAAVQAKVEAEQAATLAGSAKTGAETAAQQTGQDRAAVASDKDTVVAHVQALAEPNDAAVLGLISEGADTATKAALNATYARSIGAAPRFVEILLSMFGSPQTVWVTGQTATPTTLTGAVSAGATALPLASAAHIDGVSLVLGSGTPDQQIVRITGGGGTNTVTVAPALAKGWPSGTPVEPLWANASHLTGPGYKALARHIVQSAAFDDFPADGKVTFLGNSWVAHGGTVWAEQVTARFPNATVVNAGVSGNTSASLINRFATDVPADSDVVVFNEPGVNDTYALLDSNDMMKSLDTLVRLVRGIGAVPVYVGPPPLTEHQSVVATRSVEMGALLAVPEVFPAAPVSVVLDKMPPTAFPNNTSIGIGLGSLARGATGTKNTALGQLALASVTTGVGNTSLGNLAGSQITTGSNNLSIGDAAQQAVTTGSSNVGIGQGANASVVFTANNVSVGGRAGFAITSGHTNTNIGNQTGYASGGDPANATTTATHQTNVGSQAGQGSATQASRITTLGYRATASAYNSVALGAETAVTAANQVGIGPRSLHIDNAPAEPATPASGGVLFVQGGELKYKGSAGTVTTIAPA